MKTVLARLAAHRHQGLLALALLCVLCLAAPTSAQKKVVSAPEVTDELCAELLQDVPTERLRSHYRYNCGSECGARHRAFLKFRTTNYGRYKNNGSSLWNKRPPVRYARETLFMNRKVLINKLVTYPLACVERELKRECAQCKPNPQYPNECATKRFPYKPKILSGLRLRNTFKGGEISNHVFGISLDLDPQKNTCCGCTAKWRAHPMCQKDLPVHERMIMPMCWVEVFERYGFYWLGRDVLQDTMHFDFLGDPQKVRDAIETKGEK